MLIFEHGKDFFAEEKESLRGVDRRERMEIAVGIKSAISNEAVDVRMPGQEVAKCLNRGDEAGFK
ncbi:MAG: hypothetical protein A2Y62_05855 [Candidatus Fischerbacteria bacterium RBG_13_37_8]|uniref:Uncharacterized protein n=1 Tax=Candidatus Fischerbacteria bacterium RBG_13_37_8 TaxID=1817863 RepID=A0A1F5VDB7_9BACT|nr:MAG: hypothetical protein A2Y62_05855 [Candidatus Fischerbacteria bacterium RBG_13_37_8]